MPKATKLPSGKWRCRAYYTDFDGSYKTKSFTANTKKEAERLSATFVMEHEHAAKPENKTLGALADAYIENRSELLSPATIAGYKKIRNSAFKEIINVRIGIITKEMYQSAINTYSKGRAPKTVASANAFFSSVLKANGYNLSEGVILPQKENKEIQIPSEAEVSAFLENIAPTRIYLYCLFAATLGLRKSEIVALRWKDIDTKAKTIHISKARVKGENSVFVEKAPKTTLSERTLHMPQILIDNLGKCGKPDEYIFKGNPRGYEESYRYYRDKFNFPYNFHTLRHYYASVMLMNGVPNRYAKERMGHATEKMLQRVYQHTFADKQKEFDAVMDDVMNSAFGEKK